MNAKKTQGSVNPTNDPTQASADPLSAVIGQSPAMQEVYHLTRLAAKTTASVLLIGETGTGKELIARAIHRLSRRGDGPYIRVNCGALTESLLESELFGHVKGAFTGAIENKAGRFEAATGGTIFLDEISSMSPTLQVKLLRVLQENELERVGESRSIKVDVRLVAATNQMLEDCIDANTFREDLYYRLNVIPIFLPPLRMRTEDIPALAKHFLARSTQLGLEAIPAMTPEFLDMLLKHNWPGNVRELEHYIARAVVLSEGKPLTPSTIAPPGTRETRWAPLPRREAGDMASQIRQLARQSLQTLPEGSVWQTLIRDLERELIEQTLQLCDQVHIKAAERLGMNRNTLHKKWTEYFGQKPAEGGGE